MKKVKVGMIMMYIHYCKGCERIHILNGHKQACPACESPLTELHVSYLEYISMTEVERQLLLNDCRDDARLSHLAITYRMSRYKS